MAAVANGGRIYQPQIVEKVKTPDGELIEQLTPTSTVSLDFVVTFEQRTSWNANACSNSILYSGVPVLIAIFCGPLFLLLLVLFTAFMIQKSRGVIH